MAVVRAHRLPRLQKLANAHHGTRHHRASARLRARRRLQGVRRAALDRLRVVPPVQPSEFAKVAVVIYFSAWLASKGSQVKKSHLRRHPLRLLISLVTSLIILEPDVGTAAIVVGAAAAVFLRGRGAPPALQRRLGGRCGGFSSC